MNQIIEKEKEGMIPSKTPIAIVVGGQCGAGKSGVIGNTIEKLNSNCVVIDNDKYRYAHPNFDEINSAHPELFTECTDQLSFSATPKVIKSMIDGRYNMVIHQTLKNDTIVRCAITDLLEAGYTVVVRALAVDQITSIKDELGRGQDQLAIGRIPRWVPPENHDTAYVGLPGTVDLIETSGKYHLLEVVTRSSDKNNLEYASKYAIVSREYYNLVESKIDESLSEFEKRVLNEYELGKSYSDIATGLNSKIKSVDTAIQRIKKKANKIKKQIKNY